jgi:hypothetical protein
MCLPSVCAYLLACRGRGLRESPEQEHPKTIKLACGRNNRKLNQAKILHFFDKNGDNS